MEWRKLPNVQDVPKGNFDLSSVPASESGKLTGLDGLEYQQVPGGKDSDYYLRDNHLYTFEGKYIGEQYASGAGKTVWQGHGY